KGIKEISTKNIQNAYYAKQKFIENGYKIAYEGPFFNEFVVKIDKKIKDANRNLIQKGIIGGYDLGRDYPDLENHMLIAVTELRTKEEIDTLVRELGDGNE